MRWFGWVAAWWLVWQTGHVAWVLAGLGDGPASLLPRTRLRRADGKGDSWDVSSLFCCANHPAAMLQHCVLAAQGWLLGLATPGQAVWHAL